MKHFQWKHLRVTFLLTALPVATLGNDPVRLCSYVFIFFYFESLIPELSTETYTDMWPLSPYQLQRERITTSKAVFS